MKTSERLFGKYTIQHWIEIRSEIQTSNDQKVWIRAIDLFEKRLNTRYFVPIKRLLHMTLPTGQGFAVMTLVCSLIEFLQSCYEGKSYEYKIKENEHYYGEANSKFKAFLIGHQPFQPVFSISVSEPTKKIKTYADDFYINVRCGLLHEAATKNGWVIRQDKISNNGEFVDISDEQNKIIYRENFVKAIQDFISRYECDILNGKVYGSKNLRYNFCRKLDFLCGIKDNAPWWVIP